MPSLEELIKFWPIVAAIFPVLLTQIISHMKMKWQIQLLFKEVRIVSTKITNLENRLQNEYLDKVIDDNKTKERITRLEERVKYFVPKTSSGRA